MLLLTVMAKMRQLAWGIMLLVMLGTLSGCYACGMLWHGLTNVSSTTGEMNDPLCLRIDAFLIRGGQELKLVRPGAACGVPGSVQDYQAHPVWWPRVQGVVEKETYLLRFSREYHNVGYIFWVVDHARLTTGPHAGKEVRLVGFRPKKVDGTEYDPNPDLFELAWPPENRVEPAKDG